MSIVEYTRPIELHTELNPKLWDGNHIRKDVQIALLKIAKEYYKFLDINVPIMDLVVTGSQANYNYTEHSDLDLHLIVSYDKVQCDMAVDELFDTKRRLWKENHDISIHGVPVELYVEDINKPAVSASYSIIKNSWIKQPAEPVSEFDEEEVKRLFEIWKRVIELSIETERLDLLKKVKDLLKVFRKTGLEKDGEYGVANLTFKSLRNDGLIGKLMKAIADLTDKKLSL